MLDEHFRKDVASMMEEEHRPRISRVLAALGVVRSKWYRKPVPEDEKKSPGPAPKPVPPEVEKWVVEMATGNPWYGYKRIAVMCRREKKPVNNRMCYRVMKLHGLLQKPRPRAPELHRAAKLYELLPTKPNALWQMDVTYVHIPTSGWWYAVAVIDYYSRYLLALHLAPSCCATEVIAALRLARAEAERIHGPLEERPFLVTDNGSSFIAKRFCAFIVDGWSHVRIRYRTPQQLGLLERFHRTLKDKEIYWRLYDGRATRASVSPSSGRGIMGCGLTGRWFPKGAATRSRPRRSTARAWSSASPSGRAGRGTPSAASTSSWPPTPSLTPGRQARTQWPREV